MEDEIKKIDTGLEQLQDYMDAVYEETRRHHDEVTRLEFTIQVLNGYHNMKIERENDRYKDSMTMILNIWEKSRPAKKEEGEKEEGEKEE